MSFTGAVAKYAAGPPGTMGVVHVDSHPLRRHGAAARRLAHAQHHIRPERIHFRRHQPGGIAEHRGHLQNAQLRLRASHPVYGLQGGVDALPAEGGEPRQQHPGLPLFLHKIAPFCNLVT